MRIGIYLGSFKPMHLGHEQTLTQAAQQNDLLLFFPGFGPKGVRKGKRKNPRSGEKEDYYRSLPDQVMMTDDLGEQQFNLIRKAMSDIKRSNPESPLSRVKIFMPGEVINGYEAATGPIASALQIVGSLADHYVDNSGDMSDGVYIPFLDEYVNNPEIRLYSDVSDVSRVTPEMLTKFKIDPEGVRGIYMKNFIPVGIVRGDVESDNQYEPASFETEDISATQLRQRIRDLEGLDGEELEAEIDEISNLMPAMLSMDVKREFIRKIRDLDRQRRLSGGVFRSSLGKIEEIASLVESPQDLLLGTEEYAAYLDEVIGKLSDVKTSLKTRKKTGKYYRKEASKIQGALEALRFLKRKSERELLNNSNVLNEVYEGNLDVKFETEEKFDRELVRSFLKKIQK